MIPGLTQWVRGSDIAASVAQIQALAWEFPYAAGVAIKKKINEVDIMLKLLKLINFFKLLFLHLFLKYLLYALNNIYLKR